MCTSNKPTPQVSRWFTLPRVQGGAEHRGPARVGLLSLRRFVRLGRIEGGIRNAAAIEFIFKALE